jgi:hypothetical protein
MEKSENKIKRSWVIFDRKPGPPVEENSFEKQTKDETLLKFTLNDS